MKEITKAINDKYISICNGAYNYTNIEKLLDDVYDVIIWNKKFSIGIEQNIIKEKTNNLLFQYYFDINTTLSEILINPVFVEHWENDELKDICNVYNEKARDEYFKCMYRNMREEYINRTFNIQKVRGIEDAFKQVCKTEQINIFLNIAKQSEYFIPDLNGKISKKEWDWIHYIWYIINEYIPTETKKEIYEFLKRKKVKNLLSQYRVELLMETNDNEN